MTTRTRPHHTTHCNYCDAPGGMKVTRSQRDAWNRIHVNVCRDCHSSMADNGDLA